MLSLGWTVLCHDATFTSAQTRQAFEIANPGARAMEPSDWSALIDGTLAEYGCLHALVSVCVPKGLSENPWALNEQPVKDRFVDIEAHIRSVAIDPMQLVAAALPALRASGGASIVFVTSAAPQRNPAMLGTPHAYIAAHAAINALAKSLAHDLAVEDICVNAVAPWALYSETFFPSELGFADPVLQQRAARLSPMKRFGTQSEIGELIAFLASRRAPYVTGQIISFSGAAA
jgi:NAD(P)-dependent dehydrogenase (short-subunit alcohol dehydrogenase family)